VYVALGNREAPIRGHASTQELQNACGYQAAGREVHHAMGNSRETDMKYRWTDYDPYYPDNLLKLHLILDGMKYEAAELCWYEDTERWGLFVSGFVSEDTLDIERAKYDLLSDAKKVALTYMRVWWVTGEMQRMSASELESWRAIS
jgi:hypothetical protein